ncbi:MAG: hypothetical protein ACREYF_13925 [Gammaproteobacteria bacterium]
MAAPSLMGAEGGRRGLFVPYDAAKRHHTPVGFRNDHSGVPSTQEELARLHRDLDAKAPASAPRVDLSPVASDLALLQANRTRHNVTTYNTQRVSEPDDTDAP